MFLKVDNVGTERMCSGRLFQANRPATQNARLPSCSLTNQTLNLRVRFSVEVYIVVFAGYATDIMLTRDHDRQFISISRSHSVAGHFCIPGIQGGPKTLAHFFVRLVTLSIIDQFSNFFHLAESGENFVIMLPLKIPPRLKCVATLPCEISMSYSNS